MSTRAIIGKTTGAEQQFRGVYSHSDGYPTWLGKHLWQTVHEQFQGDVKRFVREMIAMHPGGWSSFGDICYCHENGAKTSAPRMVFTDKDFAKGDDGDAEWMYIFDVETRKLFVRDVNHKEVVGVIDLDGPEPNWTVIECGANFEHYSHYAWAHGLLPKTSNLSTHTWLERHPLDFRDAIAVIVSGRRYKMTGSGGDAAFMRKQYPVGTWLSSVIAGNGKRLDIPTAVRTQDGYKPAAGVSWVMPPTVNNPHETIVEAQ